MLIKSDKFLRCLKSSRNNNDKRNTTVHVIFIYQGNEYFPKWVVLNIFGVQALLDTWYLLRITKGFYLSYYYLGFTKPHLCKIMSCTHLGSFWPLILQKRFFCCFFSCHSSWAQITCSLYFWYVSRIPEDPFLFFFSETFFLLFFRLYYFYWSLFKRTDSFLHFHSYPKNVFLRYCIFLEFLFFVLSFNIFWWDFLNFTQYECFSFITLNI